MAAQAPEPQVMSQQFKSGQVKEVLSGDTMVIMGTNWSNGPPPTKTVCLAGLDTPRVGRRDNPDEPFAWGSREFLRKMVIGKQVRFRIEFVVPGGTRELGTVMLGNTNINEAVVEAGWAKLRAGGREPDPDLAALAAAAEASGKGLWNPDSSNAVRSVEDGVEDAMGVKDRAAGAELDAIVEYIMDAGRMRILLGPPYHSVVFQLAGLQVPAIRRNHDDDTETAEPFARQAKFLVERTTLNRDVKVVLEGVDKFNNFFGSMKVPGESGKLGNLGQILLGKGFAKCVEWSLKFATDPAVLKAEEKKAKEGRLNIWKDWVPPIKNSAAAEGEYVGVLSEAKTGDTVIVTKEDGSEEQLVLSSVRANRLGNPRQDKPYEPCSYEARELVRNYVGKKVKVSLEYTRTLPAFDDGNPGRVLTHASVMVGQNFGDNLAAKLLEAGLVQVVKHRDDDDRSAHYDDLMTADAVAAKAEKGLYQKPLPAARRFNDMTTMGGAQANSRLSSLQRLGKIRAVVEYITNGARYKLFIPKEGTFLNFAIEGIQCPSTGRNGEPDEPCAAEALAFAKSTLLQRDVYIEIASCNKGGCFTGSLLYNKKIPFAEILLTKGFAWVSGYRAPDSLRELEAKAKAAKLKLWETYVEPSGDAEETEGEAEYMEATVSHVTEGGNFHVQLRDDKGLDFITEQLASLDIAGKPQPDQCPPKGAKVCACWDDGAWYRGKVLSRVKDPDNGKFVACDVLFVDYGNHDVIPLHNLRALDPALARTEPLAKDCRLACVKCPTLEEDCGEFAAHFFNELVWGKKLVAKVEYRMGAQFVTIFDEDAPEITINELMLREGLGRVDGNHKAAARLSELLIKLRAEQDAALKGRYNLWQYGDIGDGDDPEL